MGYELGTAEDLNRENAESERIRQTPEMVRLQKDLTELGYHFTVLLNDETVYTNLSETQWRQVEKLIGPIPEQAKSITVGTTASL